MRTRLLTALVVATTFSSPLWASSHGSRGKSARPEAVKSTDLGTTVGDDGPNDGEEDTGETGPMEVLESGDQVRFDKGGKESAPGEVHTVAKGDTLWDLSSQFLGSPWYWPKVWSYNPEIANPHWIYPGNVVRFFRKGEEVPTQVEAGAGPAVRELSEIPGQEYDATDRVSLVGKIGYTPKQAMRFSDVGFVTSKELDEAGTVDSSPSEHDLLSFPDTAYISFKKKNEVRVGDRYVIFKTRTEIVHPVTGDRFGYLTQFLGTLKVLSTSDKLVTALVEKTFDEVSRGSLVGPFGEQLTKNVALRSNERELKGFIIATMDPSITMLGEHHLVVIDKGSSEGVLPGNTFTVIRQADGLRTDFRTPTLVDPNLPVEEVGTCMAVDVKDRATTCMLMRSLRDLVIGDRVEMRVGEARAASR